jgi:hypothetical protein
MGAAAIHDQVTEISMRRAPVATGARFAPSSSPGTRAAGAGGMGARNLRCGGAGWGGGAWGAEDGVEED